MHVSLFRSIARSLATLALGLSIATTPAVAGLRAGGGGGFHGGFGGFHGGFGDGGFRFGDTRFRFGERGFRDRFADRGFRHRFRDGFFDGGSGPFTPVMAIVATVTATATTDTPTTATASPISRLWAQAAIFCSSSMAVLN